MIKKDSQKTTSSPVDKKKPSYLKLREFILGELSHKLSDQLTYHGYHHTMDVVEQVNKSIRHHKITGHDAQLLRIAALAHDIGFTIRSADHEELGVKIMQKTMPLYGYSQKDLEKVSGMIRATKIPQQPQNLFEKILCDADLDYLGRVDFDEIAPTLFEEWNNLGFIVNDSNEFDKIQIKFLSSHKYHTEFTRNRRSKRKKAILEKLKAKVEAEQG